MGRERSNLCFGIFVGLLIGVICFLILNMMNSNNNLINKNIYNYSLNKRKFIQKNAYFSSKYQGSFFVTVDLSGHAYLNVYGETDELVNFGKKYQNYTLLVDSESKKTDLISAYKLNVSDVLYVQNTDVCSGDNCSFGIFVLKNGEVAYLNYDLIALSGDASVKKIDGFKNIISVTSDGWVIDINGNEYALPEDLY